MKNLRELFMKNLWRWKAGHAEHNCNKTNLDEEFDYDFIEKMYNRMIFGFARYGSIYDCTSDIQAYVDEIKKRIDIFNDTKNLELLVDAANYCLILYMLNKDKMKFSAIDDGRHFGE